MSMYGDELHGPKICPCPCVECPQADHHWIPVPLEPMDEDIDDRGVLTYDAEHGTDHAISHYACKHCGAWLEAEAYDELFEESM